MVKSDPDPTSERLEMRLTSDTAELAPARKAIEAFCRHHGFDSADTAEIGLCVNEALANVIRHAYGGVTGPPILLSAAREPDAIVVTIRDWGNGINPCMVSTKPRDPMTPGGVGLVCLKRMMDEMTFVPQPDGMLLRMSKRKSQDRPSGQDASEKHP